MNEQPTIPPIRTALIAAPNGTGPPAKDPKGDPLTNAVATKDYWLFWQHLASAASLAAQNIISLQGNIDGLGQDIAELAVVLENTIRFGTHAARLAAPPNPLGCIWMETDRSSVIYQLQQGTSPTWVYVAGTMWNTIVPDNRPTDLGAPDAGFDFRTTDSPAREFIWSGAIWVETTGVLGAAGLTHPNVVTKVGSSTGQIVEGGITDESVASSDRVHITVGGNVGIATATAQVHLSATGPSQALTGTGADGIAQFTTGTGSGTDEKLQFGVLDGSYAWIQAIKPGLSARPLVLNPGNGGIVFNTPTSPPADSNIPNNGCTIYADEANNRFVFRVRLSTGAFKAAVLNFL